MNLPEHFLTLAASCWLASAATAAAPRVVSTAPRDGDSAVNPATHELRIEFDQDMDQSGYSLCGGGPGFPKVTGPPKWLNARVIAFPVELVPAHGYSLSINCASAKKFQSLQREPVAPTPVKFQTAPGAGPAPVAAPSPMALLRDAIRDHYSYRDRVVQDWDALFAKLEPDLRGVTDPKTFAERAGRALAAAQDGHLYFKIGDSVVPTAPVVLNPNGNATLLPRLVPGWKQRNQQVASGRFPDGVGYILVASWQGPAATFAPLHEALDELSGAPGVIIDARFNSGGDERIAQEFAARFARERVLFAQHRTRHAGAWGPVQQRFLEPAPDGRRYGGKTAVLMGPRCFSSNETFLLMMRAAGARLIGERSHGSSGNPQPVDLGNGVTLMVPSWEALDASGRSFEGIGLTPDTEVRKPSAAGRDAVLEAALASLRAR